MTMKWLQISVTVDAEAAEAVADVLNRYASGGVALEADSPDVQTRGRQVIVRAFLPAADDTPQRRQRIEEALWHLGQLYPLAPPVFSLIAEADWANAWKEHYHPLRVGERIVIKPSWRDTDFSAQDILIELDPGMAFGTGIHPTTQMCLMALENLVQPGMAVLDLGTGSGVLAIAAAKLGAASVLALDIDPVAVEVARENVQRNHATNQVTVVQGSLGQAEGSYDLVVLNILAKVILALAEEGLAERIRPTGQWIAAGIIEPQVDQVEVALTARGLLTIDRYQITDWVTLIGHKRLSNRNLSPNPSRPLTAALPPDVYTDT